MNKIINLFKKTVRQAGLGQIIATGCATSILTLGLIAPSYAATLGTHKFLIKGASGSGNAYDGKWEFDVSLDKNTNKVSLKIVGVNDSSNNQYLNVVYMYPARLVSPGKYSFGGSDKGTPPPDSNYDLSLTGMLNHTTGSLMINNPVTSQDVVRRPGDPGYDPNVYKFDFVTCPEPTSTIGLLALGTLGAASTLRRRKSNM